MYVVDGNGCRLVVEDVVVDEHLGIFVRADVLFVIKRDETFFDAKKGWVEVGEGCAHCFFDRIGCEHCEDVGFNWVSFVVGTDR